MSDAAIHEAAHAVIVILMGGIVKSVDVRRTEAQQGITYYRLKPDPLRGVCVSLAGGCGEFLSRQRGYEFDMSCRADIDEMHEDLDTLKPKTVAERLRHYRAALALTKRLLAEHWGCVLAIARRLRTHETVSGALCHAIVASHESQRRFSCTG